MGRLDGITLLESLTEDERADLEKRCQWRRYAKGDEVVTRNSDNRDMFLITEGAVDIINYSMTGRPVAYATLGAGQYFGELSAIDGEPRSASAVCNQSATIAALPPQVFQELITQRPEIALSVLQRLAGIVRICDERIMDLATLGAMQRVVLELCRAATPDPITNGSWLIYPTPPQREFAARASTTRETVARVFAQLSDVNLIRRKGRTLYLADKAQLERMAQRLSGPTPPESAAAANPASEESSDAD
jgi:CRP-like cAMP-binding protein